MTTIEILSLADKFTPSWRTYSRRTRNVMTRSLVTHALREKGLTLQFIGNCIERHYTTAQHLLNRGFDYMTPTEKNVYIEWVDEVAKLGQYNNAAPLEVAKLILTAIGTDTVTISRGDDGTITILKNEK